MLGSLVSDIKRVGGGVIITNRNCFCHALFTNHVFIFSRYLEGDIKSIEEKSDYLVGLTNEKLPPWFLQQCRTGNMPVILFNMALLRRVILPIQVYIHSIATTVLSPLINGVKIPYQLFYF